MNKSIKKSFIISFILALIFPIATGFLFVFNSPLTAKADNSYSQPSDYEIERLANNVKFSSDFIAMCENVAPSEQITVYNFLAVVRFQDESEIMNSNFPGTEISYYEMLQKMYNGEDTYSVKQYYKEVSNNKLNLETIFVYGNRSIQLDDQRSVYGNKNSNRGVGYGANEMYLNVIEKRYYLEFNLLNQVMEVAKPVISSESYRDDCDYNNDSIIDSLSIVLLPDPSPTVVVEWNDLLWPHSMSGVLGYVNSYGSYLGLDLTNFKFSFNNNGFQVTKYISTYMMSTMQSFLNQKTGISDNKTDIHELGHVLGFPDYYIYDNEAGTSDDGENVPVGPWDIMAYNYLDYPQYPLSYNRLKQRWIEDSNVKEIKTSGSYSIKPVSYEKITNSSLQDRTVAYKIVNPDNENQSIWFEYRSQKSGTFDNNGMYLTNGLLVYRVDETFNKYSSKLSAGNVYAAPYNVYVFRNDILNQTNAFREVQNAPLNTDNKSMGSGNTFENSEGNLTKAMPITWQVYEGTNQQTILASNVSYVDSGMVVEVESINETNNELTFSVNWSKFKTKITKSELPDENLYNALLKIAGKSSTDILEIYDFENVTNINLSNKAICDLTGLDLFEFNSLKFLNLEGNSISDISALNSLIEIKPNLVVNLNNNKINLKNISSDILGSNNYIFLFQNYLYPKKHILFNASFTIKIYYNQFYENYCEVKLNNSKWDALSPNILTYHFDKYGSYKFSVVANQTDISFDFEKEIKDVFVGMNSSNLELERNCKFPELIITGLPKSDFNIAMEPSTIDTSIVTDLPFNVKFKVIYKGDSNYYKDLVYSFKIVDTTAPVITLNGEEKIEMSFGNTLILPTPEINIVDNGESVNYNFVETQTGVQNQIWTKLYYKATFNSVTKEYVLGDALSNVPSQSGRYVIRYLARDCKGNTSYVDRILVIYSQEVSKSFIPDTSLYNQICILGGTNKVYQDSLVNLDYINLSNANIINLQGLDKLYFKNNAFLDLSNNLINDITVLPTVLSKNNISAVNLNMNLIETRLNDSKFIFGFQGLKDKIYLLEDNATLSYNLTDDFSDYYTVDTNLSYGSIIEDTLGIYHINFSPKNSYLSEVFYTFLYANITQNLQNIQMEVNEKNVNLKDFYLVEGLEDYNLELANADGTSITKEDFATTLRDDEIILFKFYYNTDLVKTLSYCVNITDTVAPKITLNGISTIYLAKNSQYKELKCNLSDNYDDDVELIIKGSVDTTKAGIYNLTYYGKDSSGNKSEEVSRIIYVGNAEFKSDISLEYNVAYNLIDFIEFEQYTINDFNIVGNKQIKGTDLGSCSINITLQHKKDLKFYFNLKADANVVDTVKPEIYLLGVVEETLLIGSSFVDKGASAKDNFDGNITNKICHTSNLNENRVGNYYIKYTVEDSSGNVAEITRRVKVIYRPITSLKVDKAMDKLNCKIGEQVDFIVTFVDFDINTNNPLPTIVWYVDGQEVSRGTDTRLKYSFNEVGIRTIAASVLNDDGTVSYSEDFSLQIQDYGFIEKYGALTLICGIVGVFLIIMMAFIIRKRRRFL